MRISACDDLQCAVSEDEICHVFNLTVRGSANPRAGQGRRVNGVSWVLATVFKPEDVRGLGETSLPMVFRCAAGAASGSASSTAGGTAIAAGRRTVRSLFLCGQPGNFPAPNGAISGADGGEEAIFAG